MLSLFYFHVPRKAWECQNGACAEADPQRNLSKEKAPFRRRRGSDPSYDRAMAAYNTWLVEVTEVLDSINMPMEAWQAVSAFDFEREFAAGVSAEDAALKANNFW
jgi:hypothetical protein